MLKSAVLAAFAMVVVAMPIATMAQEEQSIWSGVYTEEQAARGMALHLGVCAKCHGDRGDGAGEPDMPQAPSIARASFLRSWDGQSIAGLYEYIRATMPPDNPSSRSDQNYIDIVAAMLAMSKVPAGDTELPLDTEALDYIIIEQAP